MNYISQQNHQCEKEVIKLEAEVTSHCFSASVYTVVRTGCPKSHAPSLKRYILRYENSIAIKKVCLDRVREDIVTIP